MRKAKAPKKMAPWEGLALVRFGKIVAENHGPGSMLLIGDDIDEDMCVNPGERLARVRIVEIAPKRKAKKNG